MARTTTTFRIELSDGSDSRTTAKVRASMEAAFLAFLQMHAEQGMPIATDDDGGDVYVRSATATTGA